MEDPIKFIPTRDIETIYTTPYGYLNALSKLNDFFSNIEKDASQRPLFYQNRPKVFNIFGPKNSGKKSLLFSIAKKYEFNILFLEGEPLTNWPVKEVQAAINNVLENNNEQSQRFFIILDHADNIGWTTSHEHSLTQTFMRFLKNIKTRTTVEWYFFHITEVKDEKSYLKPQTQEFIEYEGINDVEISEIIQRTSDAFGVTHNEPAFNLLRSACVGFTADDIQQFFVNILQKRMLMYDMENDTFTIMKTLQHNTVFCNNGEKCKFLNYSCHRIGMTFEQFQYEKYLQEQHQQMRQSQ